MGKAAELGFSTVRPAESVREMNRCHNVFVLRERGTVTSDASRRAAD